MKTIEVAVRTGAGREAVFAALESLSRGGGSVTADPYDAATEWWSLPFGDGRMEWIQRRDPRAGDRIAFSATEGAFHRLDGTWEVSESAAGGQEARYRARIELGVPIFDRIMEPLAVAVLRDAVAALLVGRLPDAELIAESGPEDPEYAVAAYLNARSG